jgi:hypothetical protein
MQDSRKKGTAWDSALNQKKGGRSRSVLSIQSHSFDNRLLTDSGFMHKKKKKKPSAFTPRRPALLPAHFNNGNLVQATKEVPYQVNSGILAYVENGSIVDVLAQGRADVRLGGVAVVRKDGYAMLHRGAVGYALDPKSTLVPLDGATVYYLPHARSAIQAPGGRARLIPVTEIPSWGDLQSSHDTANNTTTL